MFPLEFRGRGEVNRQETTVTELSYSEDWNHDRSWSRFDMIPDCDRRTFQNL